MRATRKEPRSAGLAVGEEVGEEVGDEVGDEVGEDPPPPHADSSPAHRRTAPAANRAKERESEELFMWCGGLRPVVVIFSRC